MKTTIAYAELNEELQELYLASKEWVSELDFLEREYALLKKLLTTALLPLVQRETIAQVSDVQLLAMKTAKRQETLKKNVLLYLLRLETYITDSDLILDIRLVETHARLAAEVALVKWNLGTFRTQVFNLSKEGKNACSAN